MLARIEHPACLLERMDWKPWTLRLAPVAAGLLLFARLSVQQTPAFSLETLMDHWMDVRGQVPATGLFWRGAPDEILFEAVLDGHPEAAMGDYGPRTHDQ